MNTNAPYLCLTIHITNYQIRLAINFHLTGIFKPIVKHGNQIGYLYHGPCQTLQINLEICDVPETSDTQREEWLFRMEPLHGAQPKWNEDGRPPVGFDQKRGVDIGAAGGVVGRSVEQRGVPPLMLPLEQQIVHEEEVRTPPRREVLGHGSHRVTEHQLPPGGTRVIPQIFTDDRA